MVLNVSWTFQIVHDVVLSGDLNFSMGHYDMLHNQRPHLGWSALDCTCSSPCPLEDGTDTMPIMTFYDKGKNQTHWFPTQFIWIYIDKSGHASF